MRQVRCNLCWCFVFLHSRETEVYNCLSSPTQKIAMVKQVKENCIAPITSALAKHTPSLFVPSWKPPCFIRLIFEFFSPSGSLYHSVPVSQGLHFLLSFVSVQTLIICSMFVVLEVRKLIFKMICAFFFFSFLDPEIWLPKKILLLSWVGWMFSLHVHLVTPAAPWR